MPTLTTQAEAILSALENTPGLREELETYFARRWEAASGFAEMRESCEARILLMEEREGDQIERFNRLSDAAHDLCYAIGDESRKGKIPALVKAVKSLL